MERLWSPWRSQYIGTFKDEVIIGENDCFFCSAIEMNSISLDTLIVYIAEYSFVIMNKYPYNNGHLLIAPKRHIGSLNNLEEAELNEIAKLQVVSTNVLEKIYKPHGFNIGANLGRAAGAGVPDHIHYHVIPRWNGDTNFMPIVAETKILSQSLEDSFNLISEGFRALI